MDNKKKLATWTKKQITLEEFSTLFHTRSVQQSWTVIHELKEEGLLKEVKASGTNGNHVYPLYMKYRITLPKPDYEQERKEIRSLHPLLQKTGHFQDKPQVYLEYRNEIQKLSRWLFDHPGSQEFISRKERSFEIFLEEKQLENTSFCNLLKKLELTPEVLCYYETPEFCFNDYIPERKEEMTLLILENKDIWFNIRRLMYEEKKTELFGCKIDGVVYGNGNAVNGKDALSGYTRFLSAGHVHYLYWGDIDRAGFLIAQKLIKENPSLDIQYFVPAYEAMLQRSLGITLPESQDHRNLSENFDEEIKMIQQELRERLTEVFQNNLRLPQEIIHYACLKENMR